MSPQGHSQRSHLKIILKVIQSHFKVKLESWVKGHLGFNSQQATPSVTAVLSSLSCHALVDYIFASFVFVCVCYFVISCLFFHFIDLFKLLRGNIFRLAFSCTSFIFFVVYI